MYKNLGNGYFCQFKELDSKKTILRIEPSKPDQYNYLMPVNPGLNIIYSDQTNEVVSNRTLNNLNNNTISKALYRSFLEEPKVFIYTLDFLEVWRSERNGQAQYTVTPGDIGNDGNNELVYTFFPVNDTQVVLRPTRIVVFESYGNNLYRIDWNTLLTEGGNNAFPFIMDLDRDGNKECMVGSYTPVFNGLAYHHMECTGQGKHWFYLSDINFPGGISDITVKDTMYFIDSLRNSGVWACFSNPSNPGIVTSIRQFMFRQKNFYGFNFYSSPPTIELGGYVYDIDVEDIDKDGKDEIIIGDTQGPSDFVNYLDSTGSSSNWGYQLKEITPNAPVSGGWILMKDFDNDNTKEITVCGIGYGTGSIGVIKHTGSPGQNQFSTMWWDTTQLARIPNLGIDTGRVDNFLTLVFSAPKLTFATYIENINMFKKSTNYQYDKIFFQKLDSTLFFRPSLFDIDEDGKLNILTTAGYGFHSSYKYYLLDFEQSGIYYYTFEINNFKVTKKMLYIK